MTTAPRPFIGAHVHLTGDDGDCLDALVTGVVSPTVCNLEVMGATQSRFGGGFRSGVFFGHAPGQWHWPEEVEPQAAPRVLEPHAQEEEDAA